MPNPRFTADRPKPGPMRTPGSDGTVGISGSASASHSDPQMAVLVPVIEQGGRYVPASNGSPEDITKVGWYCHVAVDAQGGRWFGLEGPDHLWQGVHGVLVMLVYNGPGYDDDLFPLRADVMLESAPPPSGLLRQLPPAIRDEAAKALLQAMRDRPQPYLREAVIEEP